MSALQDRKTIITRTFVFAVLIFFSLLAVVFGGYRLVSQAILNEQQKAFDRAAVEVEILITDRLREYLGLLYAGKGLFAANDYVTRAEWSTFIQAQELPTHLPGVKALEFVDRVSHEEKQVYIEKIKNDTNTNPAGYPEFTIYPEGEREEYFVINYIEPLVGNEQAFGFDLASEEKRKKALEQSRDSGQIVMTDRITLVQDEQKQAAFLICLPIYAKDASRETAAERRTALRGFILGVFIVDDVFNGMLENQQSLNNIHYEILDGNIEKQSDLLSIYQYRHDQHKTHSSSGQLKKIQKVIMIANHEWTLEVSELSLPIGALAAENLPRYFIMVGVILSALTTFLFVALSTSRERAESLAEKMTRRLSIQVKETEKFKLAVENASDHIVITDAEGIVLYANPTVETISGFTFQETVGQKAGKLWGNLMDKSFYQNMWKVIKTDKKTFIGEITNHRKNGQKYIAEIKISPILDHQRQVLFFVGIERDITKIKEIDRMKTEFLSLASHQLRTPLSAMKWFLEMLLTGDAGELVDKQRKFVTKVNQSNERMIGLVNALLNVSRIESGRIMIDPEPTNLKELVDQIITEVQPKLEEKKQQLRVKADPTLPSIKIDPKLIREVYLNLLTNAIKYTPPGGEISVSISKKDPEIISQVSDNGYGIPKAQQNRVFQKFFRGENILKKETRGTGLGLYLIKAIVESSGGKIWFQSQEGKGTTFWFSLPLAGSLAKKGEVGIEPTRGLTVKPAKSNN